MDTTALDRLRIAAGRLFKDRPILVAYAFGSRISGTPSAASDLDIGYYLFEHRAGNAISLHDEMLLAAELSEVAGCPVDLRNLGPAPLELRGRVLEDGVRLYSGDEMGRVALERDLLGRYHDYKDVFRHFHEVRLRATARRGL